MDNKILDLENYKNLLELQRRYENDLIDEDDMTIEQIDKLCELYLNQIIGLRKTLSNKLSEKSKEWYR